MRKETGLKKPCRWHSDVSSWSTPPAPLKRVDKLFSGSTRRRQRVGASANAVPKAWLNEYDITKDGVNSKLLFDLRPTIDRVHRLELTPEAYIGTKPSKKRVARVCEQISRITQRTLIWKEMEELVNELKLLVKGWGKYFRMRNAPS